jgi:putative restriction endonuclease
MGAALHKLELLSRLLDGIGAGGASALVLHSTHPFYLRIYRDDGVYFDARIYVWNISHGGGAKRPKHEFRIQITGVVPATDPNARTFVLGWDESLGVFVGFDIRHHENQSSRSPSVQVPRQALLGAHAHAFSSHVRGNGETVVAFRPEFLVEYMQGSPTLHGGGPSAAALRTLLNTIDSANDGQIAALPGKARRTVVAMIKRRFRESDFKRRVLSAYGQRCAFCGLQLRLVEAAHILPVAAEGSTDSTSNGVALCANHHKAFDAALLSFDERYQVEVSESRLKELNRLKLTGGLNRLLKFARANADSRTGGC